MYESNNNRINKNNNESNRINYESNKKNENLFEQLKDMRNRQRTKPVILDLDSL